MTQWEFEQIQSLVNAHDLGTGLRPTAQHAGPFAAPCRFRDGEAGRCRIYPARPLICRLFGLVEWLPCPLRRWGVRQPNGIDIMRWYATLGPRTYQHWLQADSRNIHMEAQIHANGGKSPHD